MKLDKDKVVRKLKGNADAARHKDKLSGISKKMAAGAILHREFLTTVSVF